MEQQQIIEGNKLIAEFMGIEVLLFHPLTGKPAYEVYDFPDELVEPQDLDTGAKYHTSWDWLMPVVEAIELAGGAVNIDSSVVFLHFPLQKQEIQAFRLPIKKESVWAACIAFIKWHNDQKEVAA